jgi:hypothetical protein
MNASRTYYRERRHLSRRSLTKADLAGPLQRKPAGQLPALPDSNHERVA